MKKDLDALMQSAGLDAILVTGPGQHNPAMVYLTGGGHLTNADLIKKRGETAVLFHGAMERDEAAKSGLVTRSYSNYPYADLLKKAEGNKQLANILRYVAMLKDAGVTSGKLGLYGQTDLGRGYSIIRALEEWMPEISFIGYQEEDVLAAAMATKDESELARIRRMGKITTEVVGRTADFLSSQAVKNEVLVKKDGTPLTVADVKSRINLWLAELGAENPEGTIFAIGHDAGVPHSSGNPADVLRLGQTIVYDIFPCEQGGGYYYDFTRTWCLGYAPDSALKLYEQVKEVYHTLYRELKLNAPFADCQKRTCELFEAQGHPTIGSNPATEVGYVHSVGHGLGLRVHEKPWSGAIASETDRLVVGSVFTLEPGLYYPEQGLGMRLEDTVAVTSEGKFEILAPYPQDLVIPVKG